MDQYSSADAASFRDWLRDKGLSTGSIQRNFTSIKAMVSFTINELGLDCRNPFSGVYLAPETDKQKRQPLSVEQIRTLQRHCYDKDDDVRWLVALISDTGMRLAEAAGLMMKDLFLDRPHPHVVVTPYPHRSLKTKASERIVPLVGASLWAAQRLSERNDSDFCLPRYTNKDRCNSNSASAAINKWVKSVAGDEAVIHGLRHSFRDRLRAAEAPSELIDQLGGWSLQSVGQSYGNGYALENLSSWMDKIVIGVISADNSFAIPSLIAFKLTATINKEIARGTLLRVDIYYLTLCSLRLSMLTPKTKIYTYQNQIKSLKIEDKASFQYVNQSIF